MLILNLLELVDRSFCTIIRTFAEWKKKGLLRTRYDLPTRVMLTVELAVQ